jgi:hypothetical protein
VTACEKFIAWIERQLKRLSAWHQARVVKWENRYIIQYEKQIADAVAGIEEAKQRRAKAASR